MGFFQDLKQDLSQTVNDLETEETVDELSLEEGTTDSEDLFGGSSDTDFSALEAMLERGVAALGDVPVDTAGLQSDFEEDDDSSAMMSLTDTAEEDEESSAEEDTLTEFEQEVDMTEDEEEDEEEDEDISEETLEEQEDSIDEEDELSSEEELELQESYMDETSTDEVEDDFATSESTSTDTAVITAGMNITGDVTSSGNMDLIGSITGNIEILGKLNVTGSITGNSAAAEIYAESAQINGELKSEGSVKIGQSSVVIGNILATSAVIAGAVKGDIDVHGPVILDTSAIVMGNIKSRSVQINNGAVVEGMCSQCYADISPAAFFNDVKKNKK